MDRNWQKNRDILISIICIGIILWASWTILGQFLDAVVLLLLAMAVAFLLTPLVNVLNRYIPRVLATLITYVLVLVALGALGYAIIFSLIQQVLTFQSTVVNFFNVLPQQFASVQKTLVQNGIPQSNITDALNQVKNQATSFATTLASNVLNIALIVTNTFIDVLLVVVISFYLTLDGKRIRDSIFSIVPKGLMNHAELFEDALNRVVGNYIRGQLTLAAIIGVLAGVGCAFLGLRSYALIIGVLAFLFETIPMVGPALASIPAILLSLLLPDPFPRTFWIVIYFIVVQMIESNILGPRIVGHAVGLHPVASILALIIGAQLFGAFGALLATPIVAAAWVVIASLYRSARGESADVMLANKRKPWVVRPNGLLPRSRRLRRTATGTLVHEPPRPSKSTAMPVEHLDPLRHVPETREQREQKETKKTVTIPVKATPISVEHIDFLHPIPDMKEQPSSSTENDEES
ncbi:MAG TPA: AI-2E family transporter [Ktedonobacteraceae bacterium]|nr:AI-2E family transporter [Ktedonobacteraceae bacterium]